MSLKQTICQNVELVTDREDFVLFSWPLVVRRIVSSSASGLVLVGQASAHLTGM